MAPRLKVFLTVYAGKASNLNMSEGPSQAEQLLRVTSGIAAELIKAHDANETISLNELRARMSKKFRFGGVPRLVDIISAIPDEYKKALLPKLKARPIRTASGVSKLLRIIPRLGLPDEIY
jgi:elongator complex protein 3